MEAYITPVSEPTIKTGNTRRSTRDQDTVIDVGVTLRGLESFDDNASILIFSLGESIEVDTSHVVAGFQKWLEDHQRPGELAKSNENQIMALAGRIRINGFTEEEANQVGVSLQIHSQDYTPGDKLRILSEKQSEIFRRKVCALLNIQYPVEMTAEEFDTIWSSMCIIRQEHVTQLMAIIEEAKKQGIVVKIISNTNHIHGTASKRKLVQFGMPLEVVESLLITSYEHKVQNEGLLKVALGQESLENFHAIYMVHGMAKPVANKTLAEAAHERYEAYDKYLSHLSQTQHQLICHALVRDKSSDPRSLQQFISEEVQKIRDKLISFFSYRILAKL